MFKEIILASGSDRRKQILSEMGLSFRVIVPQVEEPWTDFELGLAGSAARLKAENVAQGLSDSLVIASDTMVVIDGKIFGKPVDDEQATDMLRSLSGRSHEVYSGICVINTVANTALTGEQCTQVLFRELSDQMISDYISTGEHSDKAGAYGIQGKGRILVKEIKGCFFNVVGLPIGKLYGFLSESGIDLLKL